MYNFNSYGLVVTQLTTIVFCNNYITLTMAGLPAER
jgi:hypothetical protein